MTLLRLLAAFIVMTSLSACFRPLYAPNSGAQVKLAAIDVDKVVTPQGQERLGHYVRAELNFDLDGSGQPSNKLYKLTINAAERLQTPIVNTTSGRAESATLIADATYVLTSLDGTKTYSTGKVVASVSYERNPQRFATIRAARDAEIRLAKLIVDQIRVRLSLNLPS